MLIFIGLHNTALVERPIHMWPGGGGGREGALELWSQVPCLRIPCYLKLTFFFNYMHVTVWACATGVTDGCLWSRMGAGNCSRIAVYTLS